MKMYQSISYAIAIDAQSDFFEGMYISNSNPAISFRTALYENKKVLIIVGMDNKTGDEIDYTEKYKKLEDIAKKMYPNCNILFRWNTEDCISLDKIPYIGDFSGIMKNMYVATGYNKWGMTSSNIAANIITDKILGRLNQYEEVFNSKRLQPIKNHEEFGNMVKEATNSIIINKFKRTDERIENIKKGEGKIVEIDNIKVGVFKDDKGKIYAVKPICSHLKCELIWNNLDKTWDCPCHGSRFDYTGRNIYDPAINNLDMFNFEE
ncbi:Cytochrome b6-f complex iron-sulfur subunit 1 [compost metagenome]